MRSVSDFVRWLGPAHYVLDAVALTVILIALLLVFILYRRARRQRFLKMRDRRTLDIRRQWPGILDGRVLPELWRFDPLSREIVETILADRLEVAGDAEVESLRQVVQSTGLLDTRIHEARALRGWRRRQALVALGRLRAPEAVPALAEALDDPDEETRLAALRGLGRAAIPAAAEPVLERLLHDPVFARRVPPRPLLNALLACCRPRPQTLLPYVRAANDKLRPLLARVLGEVATADLDDDLLLLASDPLAEVRASAARALAEAKPRLALLALSSLAYDTEWFVRLRAVVALGELREPRAIPVLIETLCDPNRYVRLRSAAALARLEGHLDEITAQVIETRDRYALQALVSELERSGDVQRLLNALADPRRRGVAEAALLGALRAGTQRMLLDALVRHPQPCVRKAVARLLARSREPRLAAPLESLLATARTRRERRLAAWLLAQLRGPVSPAPEPRPAGVAA
jgi:HEAT repeat protein